MGGCKLKCCITVFMSNSSGLLAGGKVKLMDSDLYNHKEHRSKNIAVSFANLHVFLIPTYMIKSIFIFQLFR